MTADWRLPENRREAFQRFYSFHLKYRTHPGCVYFLLPGMAGAWDLTEDERAWMVWLNGNTQNPVTTQMLMEASTSSSENWLAAAAFQTKYYPDLEWDTDRRHQKTKFVEATAEWYRTVREEGPAEGWKRAAGDGWPGVWRYALSQPHMGRLSAWSMTEYARILLPGIPDAESFLFADKDGSRSHRNGVCTVMGYDAAYWSWDDFVMVGPALEEIEEFAEDLLAEARVRNPGAGRDVCRLTMESALCTYKSWHKPNRRYPNVYADMHAARVKRAEARLPEVFDPSIQWDLRRSHLPRELRCESMPGDPGLSRDKQNQYLETGVPAMIGLDYPDMRLD